MMDICARFGLEFNPFLKNSKDIVINTPEFSEVTARLNYLQEVKGFGLITGDPGVGKTTALRSWANNLNKSLYKVIYTPLSTLTLMEFYKNLALEMNLVPSFRKMDNIHMIQKEIERLSIERRITPVFILDELNYARNGTLNDLKILFNFNMDSKDKAIVVLSGLTILNSTLNLNIHEPLKQRIIMNYTMTGLDKVSSKAFISEKLQAAKCCKPVFDDAALEAIVNAANGVPRMLCKYANACLVVADRKDVNFVNAEIARIAIEDTSF